MVRPKVISLYTGAGGLDFGFEAAGFETVAALEFDHQCCETLRKNRKWPLFEKDIHDVATSELLEAAGLAPGEVDVVIGGPPCQPFSKAGYWANGETLRLDDPRAATLGAYMRVVLEAQPKTFLLENVAGIAYGGKSEGIELLLRCIEDINRKTGRNYVASYRVLRAADYGVPQMRDRFFLIASREGVEFQFPEPTHGNPDEIEGQEIEAYRTAWDALGDLPDDDADELHMRGKWAELLPSVPEGNNYLHHTERGDGLALFGWRRRYWSFLLKLAKNRPSWTIQAQPGPAIGPFHWKSRRLSRTEMCRLQTFPDGLEITGSIAAAQKQLGNAVPSLLAEVLARQIRTQLLGMRKTRGDLKLLPPSRTPVPKAEPLASVAGKYLPLVGEHSAHPGTGQGYRASAEA